MDRSGVKEVAEGGEVMVIEIGDAMVPRRSGRCVQKKLNFSGSSGGADDPEGDDEGSDLEKWKRKRKDKKRTPTAPPKKVFSSRKESSDNSKKASDFFVKTSQKRLQRKPEMTSLLGSNESHCQSDGQVRESTKCNDATPSPKHRRSPCSRQKMSNADLIMTKSPGTKIVDKNQPVLDLWFQAKVDAEENQRLSAGREIHPFFSSWKASKKIAETSEIDRVLNKSLLNLDKRCPPVHVFETHDNEEETSPLNWSKWGLSHTSSLFTNGCVTPECSSTTVFEDSVEALRFANGTGISNSDHNYEIATDQLLNETMDSMERTKSSPSLSPKQIHEGRRIHQSIIGCSPNNSLANMHAKGLNERLISYQIHRASHSGQNLWTCKYQPDKVTEVCGNADAVKNINDWLRSWHEKNLQKSSSNVSERTTMTTDSNCSSFQSYSDNDSEDEGNELGNVLLVSGPVGCGKSAAIYACAKEQGFEVIEVNTSDQRNGAFIKQKFGEATESHGLNICSINDPSDEKGNHSMTLKLAYEENTSIMVDVPELTSWTCNQDLRVHDFQENTADNKATVCHIMNKSLLLFEDVDTVFDEDRGFLSTILQLAQSSKRPIILTTNSKDPGLTKILLRQTVDFMLPSHEELLSLVSMICAMEKITISSLLLERLIKSCQADIRKTILHLQFWCQGKKDTDRYTSFDPIQFDTEAAHLVIPRMIPWGFSCKLSEVVAEEITRTSLAIPEEITRTSLSVKEEFLVDDVLKREEYGSVKDFVSYERVGNNNIALSDHEISDFSCSPFKITRRNRSHKSFSVMSSDSDEQHSKDLLTKGNGAKFFSNTQSPEVSLVPLSFSTGCHDDFNQFNPTSESQSREVVQHPLWLVGSQNHATTLENNLSLNVSCIPESEFITGTELDCSINHFAIASDEVFVSPPESMHVCNETEDEITKLQFSLHLPTKIENPCIYTESVHGTEDLQDLEIGRTEFLNLAGHFVDECSRADFNVGTIPGENEDFPVMVETVEETWIKLRNSCQELRTYLTNDQKDVCQILKHVTGMTNLISDADTMIAGCLSVTNDFIQPDMITESQSMSWYDQLWEITSIFGEHGLCHYVNSSATFESKTPREKALNLSQEIIACSSSIMTLGKLLSEGSGCSNLYPGRTLHIQKPRHSGCMERDSELKLSNIILPIMPLRSCMALKGHAFHEYISCLSHISKLENSRLSQRIDGDKQRRRKRAAQHYLQSCPLSLSPEDVLLLAQQCCFGSGECG